MSRYEGRQLVPGPPSPSRAKGVKGAYSMWEGAGRRYQAWGSTRVPLAALSMLENVPPSACEAGWNKKRLRRRSKPDQGCVAGRHLLRPAVWSGSGCE